MWRHTQLHETLKPDFCCTFIGVLAKEGVCTHTQVNVRELGRSVSCTRAQHVIKVKHEDGKTRQKTPASADIRVGISHLHAVWQWPKSSLEWLPRCALLWRNSLLMKSAWAPCYRKSAPCVASLISEPAHPCCQFVTPCSLRRASAGPPP